jgi:WD40 repeat protein
MKTVAAALLLLATACATDRVLARGTLAYDVAAAPGLVASVELDTGFALVLRRGDAVTRVPLGPPDHDVVDLAVDAAGRVAAVACLDGTARVHDARSGAEAARWRLDDAATAVALTPDGSLLATGAASGVLCLRRVADGALLHCVAEHAARVTGLAAAADRLVSVDAAGRLVVWRLPTLHIIERRTEARPITAVALAAGGPVTAHAPDRAVVVTRAGVAVARDGAVLVAGRPRGRFAGPLRGLAVSPDGAWLFVAGFTSRDLAAPSLTALRLP